MDDIISQIKAYFNIFSSEDDKLIKSFVVAAIDYVCYYLHESAKDYFSDMLPLDEIKEAVIILASYFYNRNEYMEKSAQLPMQIWNNVNILLLRNKLKRLEQKPGR